MAQLYGHILQRYNRCRGAEVLEYALIAGLVVISALAIVSALGNRMEHAVRNNAASATTQSSTK